MGENCQKNTTTDYSEQISVPSILLLGAELEEYYSVHSVIRIGSKRTQLPPILCILVPNKPLFRQFCYWGQIEGILFRSFRNQNRSQKNTITANSEYSHSGIVPKECALYFLKTTLACNEIILFLWFPLFASCSFWCQNYFSDILSDSLLLHQVKWPLKA